MTPALLVLRPQPGADATAAKATALGFHVAVVPLFRIVPRDWTVPAGSFDALLVTSANAARQIAGRVDDAARLYAVGQATADAAREAGFFDVIEGAGSVARIVRRALDDGIQSLLHLAGEDRTAFDHQGARIDTRIVYAAEPMEPSAALFEALAAGAVTLLHSVRAARRFRDLAGAGHRVAAISPDVLAAAGDGWAAAITADRPSDDALLAAAARLCQ